MKDNSGISTNNNTILRECSPYTLYFFALLAMNTYVPNIYDILLLEISYPIINVPFSASMPNFMTETNRFDPAEIVGGKPAPSPIPWQVSVQKFNNHICGASILSGTILLSAASCYNGTGFSLGGLSIRAGSLKLLSGGQVCNSVYILIILS